MERWKKAGDGILDFAPVQDGSGSDFGLPADRPMGALHLVEATGEIRRGAAAVFRMMDLCGNAFGRIAWILYRRVGVFRIASERGYAIVSARRGALQEWTCVAPDE
jgi:hypothetical protein